MDESLKKETLKIFRMIATEFAGIPDDDSDGNFGINSYIELFSDRISQKRFGKSYTKALAYLTAHKLKMMDKGESDGLGSVATALRINSASEGETSVSFGTGGVSTMLNVDAEYALTIYGLEFLTIKRTVIIPIVSSGESL